MTKRILGAVVALVLGLGAALAVALPAQAHANGLKVNYVACDPATGEHILEASLEVTRTTLPASVVWGVGTSTFQHTPTAAGDPVAMPNSASTTGSGTFVLGQFRIPGSTTGKGPWVYGWTEWSDAFTQGSDGQLLVDIPGVCTKPDAQDASFSVTVDPGNCLAPGKLVYGAAANVTLSGTADNTLGNGNGTNKNYSVVATATAGHVFSDGSKSKTFSGVIPGTTSYKDPACKPVFQVEQSCGYIKIVYVNNSKWARWPDYHYSGDGVTAKDAGSGPYYTAVKVEAGQTLTIFEKTFIEDYNGGSVDVWYQDILGAERDIDTASVKVVVNTDCLGTVDASATFAQEVCTGPGTKDANTATLSGDAGVTFTYTKDGVPMGAIAAGTYTNFGFGHFVVTALPPAGSLFPGNVASKVVLDETFTDAGDCIIEVVPVAPSVTDTKGCETYGSVTEVPVPGVSYVTKFDKNTGDYETVATADAGYKLPGGVASITFTGNVGAYVACTVIEKLAATGSALLPYEIGVMTLALALGIMLVVRASNRKVDAVD